MLRFTREYTRYYVRAAELTTADLGESLAKLSAVMKTPLTRIYVAFSLSLQYCGSCSGALLIQYPFYRMLTTSVLLHGQ